eukprot:TRINITY_DN19620_c0_g1_i2.p1 TRINITY_DN19620_c0_g1~~TRINITY_DN19620_c0_g1_i2.p1  ORF type:complete len:133 (+),score=26.26 TRINITY_DN19620_c0_g1_i2:111-509(+)
MIRRPPRSTLSSSSAASDVYKRQLVGLVGIAHAVSHSGSTAAEGSSDFKAGASFVLMIAALIRGLHSVFVLVIECMWDGHIPRHVESKDDPCSGVAGSNPCKLPNEAASSSDYDGGCKVVDIPDTDGLDSNS